MKKRLLSAILALCMIFTMAPTVAFAAEDDTADNGIALQDGSQLVEGTTNYVYGGCMIEFTQNEGESTYTATVRALTNEEASTYNVSPSDIGNLGVNASPKNQWDGNGDWQPADRGPFTPAPYWETYKDITTKVIVKSGVTKLNGAAFTRFDYVTSLEWEDTPTVTDIGSNFLMCSSIDELTIPSSVTYIGGYAFGKYHNTGTAPSIVHLQNPEANCGISVFSHQDKDKVLIEVNTEDDISKLLNYAKESGYQVKNLADYKEGTSDGISWTYSAGTLTLKGSGAMQNFTTDGTPWKNYMTKITAVSIADGITSIGANAFNGASNLTEIQLPKSVESIGESAFAGSGLTDKVRIPATVTSIGANAFQNVSATVYIYNGVWNNDGKTNLIDDTQIGANKVVHFIYGANIGGSTYPRSTDVLLGVDKNGTAYVDGYNKGNVNGFSFDGGYHYIEVAPDNDKDKTSDKSVVSPLFYKNTSVWPHSADVNQLVKKAVIGDDVTSLNSGLFAYCTNMTEVKFTGNDLIVLGDNVFMGTSIENIELPATVQSIGNYAFGQYGNKGKNPKVITINYNGSNPILFKGKSDETDGKFTEFVFCSSKPQAPQNITLRAHGTTNAKSYADSVGYTFVDLDADGGRIGNTNTYWTIENGNTLFIYGTGSTGDFDENTEKPWKDVTGITAIKVAAGVDTIGSYLFAGMSNVNSVTIGNGVTTINDHAFYDLTGLHSVALPTSVATVGEYAFALSTASTEEFALSIGNADADVAENATYNRGKTTTDQPIANGSCGTGKEGSYSNNITYSLDKDGVMTLTGTGEMGDFYWSGVNQPWANLRDQIKKVVYSEGITSTGSGAFAYCKNLESVTLPQNSLTTISNNTFMDAGTVSFDNLTIPASVTQINAYAFGYYQQNPNAKITSITLGNPEADLTDSTVFNGNVRTLNSTVTIYVHNQGKDCAVKKKAAEYGYKYIDLDVYSGGTLADDNLKYELYDGVLTLTAINPEKKATIPNPQQWADKIGTITKIVIGAGVRNIPADTFKNYIALTEIDLPQTLITIGANAFATDDATDLELTVTIPKSVTNLADSAFAGRSNVKMSSYANTAGGNFTATGVTNTSKKEFKVLLIGNSYSEDASDWTANGAVSHSYEIYKSILGDDVDLTIGLMASGGKVLAWHATNAYNNNEKYTLRLTDENGKWTYVSTVKTIKDALAYDDWDVVSLQPYDRETTTGEAGNNQGDYAFDADKFGTLDKSIPYFLDLTESYVPHAQVYYYMHLSEHGTGNYADGLNATNTKYKQRTVTAQTVKSYTGTIYTGKKLTDVIPVGTAIQNARTTYLTALSNADTSVSVNLTNDPVFGLQRDGGHLTYNVGRYIAALTFAEKIIPSVFRNNAAVDCGMRDSQSVGKLPAQYAEIARKAVAAALRTPYQVTTIDGYAADPITAIKAAAEGTYAESDWTSDAAFKAAVETKIAEYSDAKVESVQIAAGKAAVALRYGYSTANVEITYSPDAVANLWTSYIESTDLGRINVPGSDMKYSEVPQIQAAMAKGYSDIWAATTADAAANALDDSKSALLATVKDYVKSLADTVYNNGKATELNGKQYSVSEADYNTAIAGIQNAADISGVLSAYDAMLTKQTVKTIAKIAISANKPALTGSGSVKLTVTATTDAAVSVVCDDDSIAVKDNGDNTYTVSLPNETKTYTFKASSKENNAYTAAEGSCTVSVTHKSSSSSGSSSGSTTTTNTVSASTASNGKVTMDKTTAKKGDTVTITVTPDKGYELGKLTVTDSKGNTLTVTDKGNGKYTFTMPNGKVTVTPTFTKVADDKPSTSGYVDVASSAWYTDAVQYVTDKGLMSGTGDNKFSPNASTTRGMLMTVLARYAGKDTTGSTPWYQAGMDWAKANGVSDGTKPTVNITREQLVTMLYRYAGSPAASGSLDNFSDSASVSSYAVNAMQWAVANGIVNGSNGQLNPKNNATRAEVAAILMRFCEMSK